MDEGVDGRRSRGYEEAKIMELKMKGDKRWRWICWCFERSNVGSGLAGSWQRMNA